MPKGYKFVNQFDVLIKEWFNTDITFKEFVRESFDPYKNNFKTVVYNVENWSKINLPYNEIWFENKALIV